MVTFHDVSKFAENHRRIVELVFSQVGLDLNKYRTGDGSSPYHTHYWEQDGPGLVIDRKSMPRTDFQKLQSLHTAGAIELHDFGAWMSIIF